MNVKLTPAEHAEVLRQMPCPIYLIVEGDLVHPDIRNADGTLRRMAPSRFVEATGPCETCGGEGIRGINLEPPDQGIHWCPSCEGTGIKRAELRVTCPGCLGTGWQSDDTIPGVRHSETWHCEVCDKGPGSTHNTRRTGSVLFAHATAEVLPVVSEFDNRHLDPPFVELTDLGLCCLMFADGYDVRDVHGITLDPLPVPGRDWIVVLDGLVLA